MSYIVKAGTPAPRYPIVKGTADPRGLYPWSVLNAPVCHIDANLVQVASIPNAASGYLLVFTCDVPVLFKGTTSTGTTVPGITFNISLSLPTVNLLLSEQVPMAAQVTIADYGQVGIGYTLTNLVPCSGFAGYIASLPVSGGGTNSCNLFIEVFALGDVISAPIGQTNYATPSNDNPRLIFLREADYTQEIRDNGNIYVEEDGLSFLVVGLHNFGT